MIHSLIWVLDERKSPDFYRSALGMNIADRFVFDGFTLIYLRNPENAMEIELTANKGRDQPYGFGQGNGNFAAAVQDLDSERIRLSGAGLSPTPNTEFFREGLRMARFFFITDPDGYEIEVLLRHDRNQ